MMSSFDYELPAQAIAQTPVEPRDAARLLVATDSDGDVTHRRVSDLPDLLDEGDVVVVNETRVLPARLRLTKETGGAVEVLLLEPQDGDSGGWEALVRPSRRLPEGTTLRAGDDLTVEIGEPLPNGRRAVRLHTAGGDQLAALDSHGVTPLPPGRSPPPRPDSTSPTTCWTGAEGTE